jgi:flagellar biosynthesis/type III secretory pathway M-ring protein FliF/YscJ
MAYLIVLVVLAVVVYAVSEPLRRARSEPSAQHGGMGADPIAELEAARDAKYREIRDAELDVRTGKLSDDDYAALDGTLRGEAIEILHDLDRAREELPSAP